jgi:hypothetical protein
MKKSLISLAATIGLLASSSLIADDAVVTDPEGTEESVILTLPDDASETGRDNSAFGLGTANEARERRQDFGRDKADEARSRRDSAPQPPVAPAGRP